METIDSIFQATRVSYNLVRLFTDRIWRQKLRKIDVLNFMVNSIHTWSEGEDKHDLSNSISKRLLFNIGYYTTISISGIS